MHNREFVIENKWNKILWDFGIQTYHVIVKKRENQPNSRLCRSGWPQGNLKESKKSNKYVELAWELKKQWNTKVTILPIVIGALGTVTKGLVKVLEDLEIRGRVETI